MPKKYPDEVKDRAVWMVLEHQGGYSLITVTCGAVNPRLGIPRNTLRRWVDQARIDEGDGAGTTSAESEEIRAVKKENRRLREANEILRAASIRRRRSARASRGTRPAPPLICAFIDAMRRKGFAACVGLRGAA